MPRQPNVLFILSDQHNAKVLGHAGHLDAKTPHLDRLAAEGVRFDAAVTQNPICTPSRVSWLSGQYCHNHGYYGLSGANPGGLPTVLGHFRRHGYLTAAMGKIHCPEYWVEDDSDTFLETCKGCSVGGSPEYDRYLEDKGLATKEDHIGLQEFGRRGVQSCDGRPSNLDFEDSMEGWSVAHAIEHMERAAKGGQPFFVHVSLPKPHQCYTPSRRFWDLYDERSLHLPPNLSYPMEGKAPHLVQAAEQWRTSGWQLFEPRTFEAGSLRKYHGYLGSVSHVDHAAGELLHWLDEHDLRRDTIVVYSADHGDYACEHGIMEKAPGICSDAITRIPMIWSWPGRLPAGKKRGEVVEAVDFANTVSALAGLEAMPTADGKDISPILQGEGRELHEIGLTEFAWSKSARRGKYRLVYYPREMFAAEYPGGFGELYDLEADPWEMRNLYFDPARRDVVLELERALLDQIVTSTRPATVLPAVQSQGDPKRVVRYKNATERDAKISPDLVRAARRAGGRYI